MNTIDLYEIKITVIESMGGVAKLARLLNISSQAISQWAIIPLDRAIQIEERSGGRLKCCDIRPDIFPICPHYLGDKAAS